MTGIELRDFVSLWLILIPAQVNLSIQGILLMHSTGVSI